MVGGRFQTLYFLSVGRLLIGAVLYRHITTVVSDRLDDRHRGRKEQSGVVIAARHTERLHGRVVELHSN